MIHGFDKPKYQAPKALAVKLLMLWDGEPACRCLSFHNSLAFRGRCPSQYLLVFHMIAGTPAMNKKESLFPSFHKGLRLCSHC